MDLKHGDCLAVMKDMDENSVHAVVTDPPYGLAFMGNSWDDFDPKELQKFTEKWASDVLRVLKPGGHMLCFGGARTYHRIAVGIEGAGFEIRDCLSWNYGAGFPKSRDMKKSTGNNDWEGYGTQLKPSWEPIIMARKPIKEDTITDQVLKTGTGAINIDGCRIDASNKSEFPEGEYDTDTAVGDIRNEKRTDDQNPDGRHPANTTLTHTRWCRKRGTKRVEGGPSPDQASDAKAESKYRPGQGDYAEQGPLYADKDGKETVEDWDCPPCCPVRKMDESSGIDEATGRTYDYSDEKEYNVEGFVPDNKPNSPSNRGDGGGASRFFYTGKATTSEREMGMEEGKCQHPTVKPLDLIRWLIKMVAPTNQESIVLDPFMGSGTTGIATAQINGKFNSNLKFVGIEQDDQYFEWAKQRVQWSFNYDWKRHFALEEWQEFNGVGSKTAEDLLDELGSVSEADFNKLESVSGIGSKTAEDIRSQATDKQLEQRADNDNDQHKNNQDVEQARIDFE